MFDLSGAFEVPGVIDAPGIVVADPAELNQDPQPDTTEQLLEQITPAPIQSELLPDTDWSVDVDKLIRECEDHFRAVLRPPPDFTIDEWADKHRQLPREGADESGQWRTSRTPYLREIMQEISPISHTEDIVVMKGSQLGATEIIFNVILFHIAQNPCSMLWIEPTITVAQRNSRQRLQPSIVLCDETRTKVSDNKSRKGGNTTLEKDFPGGSLFIGGANSAATLRSMPVPIVLQDEIDAYPEDVDGEGDPVEILDRRNTNFSRRKSVKISTPTIAEVSRIAKLFEESDQRYFNVPCPFCGHKQIIKWDNIKFDNRDPDTVRLECENCHAAIHEHHKTKMLEQGEWKKLNPISKIAGFHISALYSPLGWYSWKKAVKDFIKALGNPLKLKVFFNTVLGEVFDTSAATVDFHWLMKRKEKYETDVPERVLVLVNGTDTQDNRLESTTLGIGWDINPEYWVVDHSVFYGDPKQPDVWALLDQHLLKQWRHPGGQIMNVACTCIDSMGHCTDEVYKFCRPREFRRVFPTKGYGGPGRPFVWRMRRQERGKVMLVHLGVDQAKASLYSNLLIKEPGPGYIHFPTQLPGGAQGLPLQLNEDYFKQLTAEKKLIRHASGLPKVAWFLPAGKRNEALDCFVNAMAALQVLKPNLEMLAKENMVFRSQFTNNIKKKRLRMISPGVK
jgi:phage terminase large subunit GpA-like protein